MRQFSVGRPLSFFDNFEREFDQFFTPKRYEGKEWRPLSRVQEKENYYHLALDIPGVGREDLKVELKNNILSISGQRKDHFKEANSEGDSFIHFESQFSLPKGINSDEIEVHQEDGVLDVIIPKLQKQDQVKNIEIKAGKNQLLG